MFKIKKPFVYCVIALLTVLCSLSCVSTGGSRGAAEPEWVSDPYKVYNRAVYIAAVGYGPSRDTAEKTALTNLTSIFGQSIQSESRTDYSYTQAVEASTLAWSEKSDLEQAVKTSVAMDTLIGAEIKDVWKNSDGIWYASAIMDRAKTNMIYGELIQQNLDAINSLTRLTAVEKQSFGGFLNYYQAASLADANLVFANVRNVISPGALAGENLKTGNDYRLEAAQIAKTIPITVIVENDVQNRIKGAFSSTLTNAGFLTGGYGERYVLIATLSLNEVVYQNSPYRFIRYVVDASLIDTSTGVVLFPYNINDREGHVSLSEAQNMAVKAAEARISSDYLHSLQGYIARD
jgi:hypothetical protein